MGRLSEKLAAAGAVAKRQHDKIEARADAVIAREADLEKLTDQAFSPHELLLDEAENGLAALEKELAVLSNNPPSKLSSGSQGDAGKEKQTITPDQVGDVAAVLYGDGAPQSAPPPMVNGVSLTGPAFGGSRT